MTNHPIPLLIHQTIMESRTSFLSLLINESGHAVYLEVLAISTVWLWYQHNSIMNRTLVKRIFHHKLNKQKVNLILRIEYIIWCPLPVLSLHCVSTRVPSCRLSNSQWPVTPTTLSLSLPPRSLGLSSSGTGSLKGLSDGIGNLKLQCRIGGKQVT